MNERINPDSAVSTKITDIPRWISETIEQNESFRFEALTLLERARSKHVEISMKPFPESGSAAFLEPLHLIASALLAAKGFRAGSLRGAVELMGKLYPGDITKEMLECYVLAHKSSLDKARAEESTIAFVEIATRLLTGKKAQPAR